MYAVPAAHGPISAATCGMTPLIDDLLAEQVARAGEQRADRLLDARAGGVEQPDERDPLRQRELAQARDLDLAGHAHRAGHDREVVGADRDQPAVDLAVAGDDAVGRRLLALQSRATEKWMPAWMPSSVNVPSSMSSAIRSRAVSLSARVLLGDLLLPAAEPRLRAALVRAPRRAGAGAGAPVCSVVVMARHVPSA